MAPLLDSVLAGMGAMLGFFALSFVQTVLPRLPEYARCGFELPTSATGTLTH